MANKQPVVPAFTLHGGPPLQRSYPEAASQTFVKGEAVYLNGSGHVAEFTLGIDTGGQRFLGFAAADASNDTVAATREVGVYLVQGTVFEMTVSSNGSDQVTALAQVGTVYPMYHDTTNGQTHVDIADTGGTLDSIRVFDVSDRANVGETNGRVLVTIELDIVQVAAGT